MKKIRISRLLSGVAGESLQLFIAEGIGMAVAMIIYFLRTKYLSVEDVGQISYVVSLVSVISIFFTFGIDNSGGRLVLSEKTYGNKKDISGFLLFVAFVIFIIFNIFMVGVSFLLPLVNRADSAPLVRLVAPFIGYNLVLLVYNEICYARGAIKQVAFQLCSYYVIYLAILIILNYFGAYNVRTAIFSEFLIHFLVILVPILLVFGKRIRPNKEYWEKLVIEEKERGLAVYLSRIVFLPAFNLSNIILGIFHPLSSVAHYSLCNTIASPIGVVGESIGKSLYRKMRDKNGLGKKEIGITLGITVVFAGLLYIAGVLVIQYLLSDEYLPMLQLLPLAVISFVIRGVTSIFTYFMNANGMANELKVVAYVGFTTSLIANFGLIIPFAAMGGVFADIIILTVNLLVRVYFCRKHRIMMEQNEGR